MQNNEIQNIKKILISSASLVIEKGFRSDKETQGNLDKEILLLKSEVFEAFEDARKNDFETYYLTKQGKRKTRQLTREGKPQYKPCGFWNELADVLIRIADYNINYLKKNFTQFIKSLTYQNIDCNINDSNHICRFLFDLDKDLNKNETSQVMSKILSLAKQNNVNMYRELKLKFLYNQTRPPKHGKQF